MRFKFYKVLHNPSWKELMQLQRDIHNAYYTHQFRNSVIFIDGGFNNLMDLSKLNSNYIVAYYGVGKENIDTFVEQLEDNINSSMKYEWVASPIPTWDTDVDNMKEMYNLSYNMV